MREDQEAVKPELSFHKLVVNIAEKVCLTRENFVRAHHSLRQKQWENCGVGENSTAHTHQRKSQGKCTRQRPTKPV